MKSNLLMDFSIDKANNKIIVKREFSVGIANVWAAWTQSEILEKWWAPKPWKAKTKIMQFEVGGFWFYAMIGPDGDEHFGKAVYTAISPLKKFEGTDVFCDANGNEIPDLPKTFWVTSFESLKNDLTLVKVEMTFNSFEDLEKNIEMGFKEGFTAALQNLDEVLG